MLLTTFVLYVRPFAVLKFVQSSFFFDSLFFCGFDKKLKMLRDDNLLSAVLVLIPQPTVRNSVAKQIGKYLEHATTCYDDDDGNCEKNLI